MIPNCERIVDVYNTCLDSDNILYPDSNYKRCFNPRNVLYVCSEIEKLDKIEQNLCSNFTLPSIAWENLHKSQFDKQARYHCEGYEYKILTNYDTYLKAILYFLS